MKSTLLSSQKRILVTGGAGFIGSHLIDYILSMESNAFILCMDANISSSMDNVAQLNAKYAPSNFEFIRHDITQPITNIDSPLDEIYHFACPASPVHYQFNPIKTIKTNVSGTLHVCGLARKTGARLLLASTSEVYGDPLEHPQGENYCGNVNCFGPRACYDEGKRIAETICAEYHRVHGVDVRTVRIFNTFGPRMSFHDGRVVSNFICSRLRGEAIPIYGDGTQSRSFCFVDDLVRGIYTLMNVDRSSFWKYKGESSDDILTKAASCPQCRGSEVSGSVNATALCSASPVNLGNPKEFTILQLAKIVNSLVHVDMFDGCDGLEFRQFPENDPLQRQPIINRAKQILGWTPNVVLEDGLRLTIRDFSERSARCSGDLEVSRGAHQKGARVL